MNSRILTGERWLSIMDKTIDLIQADETYGNMTAQEKLLSFYYYHLDVITDHEAFITSQFLGRINPVTLHFQMGQYRSKFDAWIRPVVDEAIREKSLRPFPGIDQGYRKFFWLQHLFILRYWATDESKDGDLTVALIEKSLKSTFDFVGKCEWKSSFDFWKFVAQNPFKLRPNHE